MAPPTPSRRWLVPVALAAAFGGFAGYRLDWWRESPREAWDVISAAAAAGDYGAVWDRFDPASQQRMAPRLREFVGATDRDRFARACAERPDVMGQFLPGTVLGVEQSGEWGAGAAGPPGPARPLAGPGPDQRRHPGPARRAVVPELRRRPAALNPSGIGASPRNGGSSWGPETVEPSPDDLTPARII